MIPPQTELRGPNGNSFRLNYVVFSDFHKIVLSNINMTVGAQKFLCYLFNMTYKKTYKRCKIPQVSKSKPKQQRSSRYCCKSYITPTSTLPGLNKKMMALEAIDDETATTTSIDRVIPRLDLSGKPHLVKICSICM